MKQAAIAVMLTAAALAGWWTHDAGPHPLRVYVERTYEHDRLEQLLALYHELAIVSRAGSEDVSLRVEALPGRGPDRAIRAVVRARTREDGHAEYAVLEFLRVRNGRGGRARWAASSGGLVAENDVSDILATVIRRAAHHGAGGRARSPEELVQLLDATSKLLLAGD